MLRQAVQIKDSLDLFVARHSTIESNKKGIADYVLSVFDWNYTTEVIAFIEPLEQIMLSLQGKPTTGIYIKLIFIRYLLRFLIGANRYAYQVLPAYDFLKEKMTEQLYDFMLDDIDQYNPAEIAENQLQINITNAIHKLDKYQQKLTSSIYLAAVVLMPWYK